MAENGWDYLGLAGVTGKYWKMAGIGKNGWNGLKWLDMAGHGWKLLEMAMIAGNVCI